MLMETTTKTTLKWPIKPRIFYLPLGYAASHTHTCMHTHTHTQTETNCATVFQCGYGKDVSQYIVRQKSGSTQTKRVNTTNWRVKLLILNIVWLVLTCVCMPILSLAKSLNQFWLIETALLEYACEVAPWALSRSNMCSTDITAGM